MSLSIELFQEPRPYMWLLQEYDARKEKNKKYSLRAFAQHIEVPSGRLTEILTNKRDITDSMAEHLIKKLAYDETYAEKFREIVREQLRIKKELKQELKSLEAPIDAKFLADDNEDKYRIIADWFGFAIISVLQLPQKRSSAEWVANKLGLSRELVEFTLERLEKLNILDRSKDEWKILTESVKTTDEIRSEALMEFHSSNLEHAIERLDEVSVTDRDFSSVTMAIDKELIPFAKGMIDDFRRKFMKTMERSETKDEVYRLNIQLYPLTHSDSAD